jgi:hypothetical protein
MTGQNNTENPAEIQNTESESKNDPPHIEADCNQTRNKTMDIHHPHSPHPKKKFTDYLFEFFLLFLAVTAGFFVENIREHYVERQREVQYVSSLISDLATDTLEMQNIIETTRKQLKGIDSLMKVLESPTSKTFIHDIYFYTFNYLNSGTFFEIKDGTISQLKNAGGFRLIRQAVSDSISEYYSLADNVKTNNEFALDQFKILFNNEKELFNFRKLRMDNFSVVQSRQSGSDIPLLTNDPEKLEQYYNNIFSYASNLGNCNRLLIQLRPRASFLIAFLKKTYDTE